MSILAEYFAALDGVNIASTITRLGLAVIFGGIVGLERGAHNHPAGFRTHVLVCVGACLAMLTNHYVFENISALSDPTRLGAQVITGVGFLGVGTILITGRHKIKGLTTAAGLWASACMGLALGIGFYSGAIVAAIFIIIALVLFPKLEAVFYSKSRVMEIYAELDSVHEVKTLLTFIRDQGIIVMDTHFSPGTLIQGEVGVHFNLKLPKNADHSKVLESIGDHDGVSLIEEL